MKLSVFGLVVALSTPIVAQESQGSDLIDADLSAWSMLGDANWRVQGGVVSANEGNGFLVSKKSYENYSISLDFWADEDSNSGVFMRCVDAGDINDASCYEVNIFDKRPDPSGRTGAIVNVAPPLVNLDTEGQWNTYEILANGDRLIVRLNGVVTVDTRDSSLESGPIALQYAGGGIRFRNVLIRELPSPADDQRLVGVWELSEFTLDDGQGNVSAWCEGSHGVIIYYADYMSVAINCATDSEKMVHYSGPYHLEGDTVVHDVRNYSSEALQQIFRRRVEMPEADVLRLVGPFGNGGKAIVAWKRR